MGKMYRSGRYGSRRGSRRSMRASRPSMAMMAGGYGNQSSSSCDCCFVFSLIITIVLSILFGIMLVMWACGSLDIEFHKPDFNRFRKSKKVEVKPQSKSGDSWKPTAGGLAIYNGKGVFIHAILADDMYLCQNAKGKSVGS